MAFPRLSFSPIMRGRWFRGIGRRRPRFGVLLAAALFLAACPGRSWALDISETRWGFDGRATAHCFNPLSVLVSNPAPEPFEGILELRESIGGGTRVGALLAEELYVAPFASRWVQFYPYIKERYEIWALQWGRRPGERADVPQARLADQQPVLLVEADDSSSKGGAIRHFSENLFPPMVTATDALTTAALDHVPRWEEARRQAFYDWLFRGGRLHLFRDVNGAYPQFTATLAELNAPGDHFRVGNGQVFRHDRLRGQIDAEFMQKSLGVTKNARGEIVNQGEEPVEVVGGNGAVPQPIGARPGAPADALFPDLTGGLFAFLKGLTRPHHNWALIYTMAAIYVLTVVPGVHILGRKRYDYRLVYGTLVGLIVLFSLGFAFFGRRGHDEANTVNSVAVARTLPGGALDITAWSNVFVINGADYDVVHGGTGRLYSTAQTFEPVNGVIRNGAQGRFHVDIPPYSSQPFVHRMKLKGDAMEVKVREFAADKKLTKLSLTVANDFPHPAVPDFVPVLYRDQVYRMNWTNERLNLADSKAEPLAQFLSTVQWNDLSPYVMRYGNVPGRSSEALPEAPFETIERPLIAWSLNLRRHSDIPSFRLPDDRVRLFVWAQLPENMKVEGQRMGRQQGRLLYVVDIPKPVKP